MAFLVSSAFILLVSGTVKASNDVGRGDDLARTVGRLLERVKGLETGRARQGTELVTLRQLCNRQDVLNNEQAARLKTLEHLVEQQHETLRNQENQAVQRTAALGKIVDRQKEKLNSQERVLRLQIERMNKLESYLSEKFLFEGKPFIGDKLPFDDKLLDKIDRSPNNTLFKHLPLSDLPEGESKKESTFNEKPGFEDRPRSDNRSRSEDARRSMDTSHSEDMPRPEMTSSSEDTPRSENTPRSEDPQLVWRRGDDGGAVGVAVARVEARVAKLDAEVAGLKTRKAASTFVHWGSSTCGSLTEIVYAGWVGGSSYTHKGAAANYLCLSMQPTQSDHAKPPPSADAEVWGAEYEIYDSEHHHDNDAVCSVCRTALATTVMIPGTTACSPGWTPQYTGWLMAGRKDYDTASEFICVDAKLEGRPGTQQNDDGKLLSFAAAHCGSLPCGPYVQGNIVPCVVCSQ